MQGLRTYSTLREANMRTRPEKARAQTWQSFGNDCQAFLFAKKRIE